MSTAQQNHEAAEEDLKLWLAFYTLVDIFLMFAGLIVMNTTAWWIRVPYHIAAILLAIFVMRLAYIAARYVPNRFLFSGRSAFSYICRVIRSSFFVGANCQLQWPGT